MRAVLKSAPVVDRLYLFSAMALARQVAQARAELDVVERNVIERLKDLGLTWEFLATEVYGTTRQTLYHRYRTLGGTRTWPPGRQKPRVETAVTIP